jgi:hypothetical protein
LPKVIVKTGTVYDGEYDLDLSSFSWRERAYIAEVSGTTAPNFATKWLAVDPKTVIATIAVMMQRSGVTPDLDTLFDASEDAYTIDYSDMEQEEEKSPPGDGDPSPGSDGSPAETPGE